MSLVILLFLSLHFWYGYNSFPTTQNIEIINHTGRNISIIIEPIYKFDKKLNINLNLNKGSTFMLFGGGEYQKLKDKQFKVVGYDDDKEIFVQKYNVSDFIRGTELEPKIIIK
ncbi:MAG: hypothetical protein GY828_00585 [Candidatus Gracilibacteria bacterium]|nr:hypothetical protein [Candidatus Gracilibacteria bacterium]